MVQVTFINQILNDKKNEIYMPQKVLYVLHTYIMYFVYYTCLSFDLKYI